MIADSSGAGSTPVDVAAQAQSDAAATAGAVQASTQPSNIPLWLVRPGLLKESGSAYSSAVHTPGYLDNAPSTVAPTPQFQTKDTAQASWLDLSESDKQQFAQMAAASDFWKPQDGAPGLVQAWYHAVDMASLYNDTHKQDQWISPFEALSKMGGQNAAQKNGKIAGTTTLTTVHQYTTDDLYSSAKQILQRELGRDPTSDELRAYTLAVNHAAAAQPEVTTTTTNGGLQIDPSTGMPIDGQQQRVIYGSGGFNPDQTIENMVKKTDEYAKYQAAVDYFPAVMNALGAIA